MEYILKWKDASLSFFAFFDLFSIFCSLWLFFSALNFYDFYSPAIAFMDYCRLLLDLWRCVAFIQLFFAPFEDHEKYQVKLVKCV